MPQTGAALVPVYNLGQEIPEELPPLVFNLTTLGDIFRGNITSWRDPQILIENPELDEFLPNATIRVCAFTGDTSKVGLIKRALGTYSQEFANEVNESSIEDYGEDIIHRLSQYRKLTRLYL